MNLNGAIKCCQFDESCQVGIVATNKGTLWYVNWDENTSVRLVSTHLSKINSVCSLNEKYISTASDDGSVCIWSLQDRERLVQFEVKSAAKCQAIIEHTTKHCNSMPSIFKHFKSASIKTPPLVIGYADGTVRVFDIEKKCIVHKLKPFSDEVTRISHCKNSKSLCVSP